MKILGVQSLEVRCKLHNNVGLIDREFLHAKVNANTHGGKFATTSEYQQTVFTMWLGDDVK